MGGGLLQLVAYGAQDVYLTGNPQITFFKVVYRRHTNFAIEAIVQTPTGGNTFGSRASFQITRNGDLIHRVYFYCKIKAELSSGGSVALVPNFGQRLLKTVELEIGGQRIDKHYSEWLYIWNELSLPVGKREGYNTMVGANPRNICTKLTSGNSYELYVPLEFWFCRNVGLALPLIALQYHEVKVNINFESATKCGAGSGISFNASLWVDYIYLDTDERRKFAQLSHEYLIEQLQFTGQETLSSSTTRVKLNFNHPCKELIWVAKTTPSLPSYWYNYTYSGGNNALPTVNKASDAYNLPNSTVSHIGGFELNDWLVSSNIGTNMDLQNTSNFILDNYIPYVDNVTSTIVNPFETCLLQLNGNDRFNFRDGNYFNLVQPYQHHTNIPLNRGINVYSFALKPEEHQPSGTLNMSRIDTAILDVKVKNSNITGNINIYAVNYNVLRILSGMGGLAYSN